eukprot:TRINITY_DN94260_c0_g1_i1.p1 TRINITY_DN94260_c0_g1~~TRINITY_DN94260_c0_g1_i1.p1  ORF type:complete len:772 (-),score=58.21 TRINITY_DN94260_c0_g1_i1:689-3004(-)
MKVDVDGLEVIFPYHYVYPEQYEYMLELKHGLDAGGHLLLEMPSGTGKTVSLLSLIVAYQDASANPPKLVYCTRTVVEMEKVLEELKRLIAFRAQVKGEESNLIGLGLTARKNLCCNNTVNNKEWGSEVDAACRTLTASWTRTKAQGSADQQPDIEDAINTGCTYFNGWWNSGKQAVKPGVYTLQELKAQSAEAGHCPYYTARYGVEYANVVIFNYSYLLDPKIAQIVTDKLPSNSVIVFDEAHNIDSVCIEVLSVNLNVDTMRYAGENIESLHKLYGTAQQQNSARLQEEYDKLVEGLALAGMSDLDGLNTDQLHGVPVPTPVQEKEAVPGNMRRIKHFLFLLERIRDWLSKYFFSQLHPKVTHPKDALTALWEETKTKQKHLKFCTERLHLLFNTLEIPDLHNYRYLLLLTDFVTVLASYCAEGSCGFQLVYEPYDDRFSRQQDQLLQLACMDASLALKPVFDKFHCVVLTSGTLSPLDMYPKLLSFTPLIQKSFKNTLPRNCIRPMVVTKGADQVYLTSQFQQRSDPAVIRNYGNMIVELAANVPDGIICFFTSYQWMEEMVSHWHDMELLNELTQHKLIFIETQNVDETALALQNYRAACDIGRGAVFFSIARGKVAEGIDFDGHYGRAVVMLGVPFVYTEDRVLKERLKWIDTNLAVRDNEYLAFDALRHASQCIGRVLRNKSDYGLMILADKRYNMADKRNKLPPWVQQHLLPQHMNLSADVALSISKEFLKEMAQPWSKPEQFGASLLREEDIAAQQAAKRQKT